MYVNQDQPLISARNILISKNKTQLISITIIVILTAIVVAESIVLSVILPKYFDLTSGDEVYLDEFHDTIPIEFDQPCVCDGDSLGSEASE